MHKLSRKFVALSGAYCLYLVKSIYRQLIRYLFSSFHHRLLRFSQIFFSHFLSVLICVICGEIFFSHHRLLRFTQIFLLSLFICVNLRYLWCNHFFSPQIAQICTDFFSLFLSVLICGICGAIFYLTDL